MIVSLYLKECNLSLNNKKTHKQRRIQDFHQRQIPYLGGWGAEISYRGQKSAQRKREKKFCPS